MFYLMFQEKPYNSYGRSYKRTQSYPSKNAYKKPHKINPKRHVIVPSVFYSLILEALLRLVWAFFHMQKIHQPNPRSL